jgi:hypothetical protein
MMPMEGDEARLAAARDPLAAAAPARAGGTAVSKQIGAADTGLLFGGADAEGGIGDWYVTNGMVEAIIDDAGPVPDLIGIVRPEDVPPINSFAAPTGGNLLDLGLVGADDDQLSQMFTVGGLSTSNFVVYDSVTAPSPASCGRRVRCCSRRAPPRQSVHRAHHRLQRPGQRPVSDHRHHRHQSMRWHAGRAHGLPRCVRLDDARQHPVQRRARRPSAAAASTTTRSISRTRPPRSKYRPSWPPPARCVPADGVVDPADGTVSGEVAYGLLPVEIAVDADGPGGNPPVVTPVDSLFGVSSTLASALGNPPGGAPLAVGGTFAYTRRFYVGESQRRAQRVRHDAGGAGDALRLLDRHHLGRRRRRRHRQRARGAGRSPARTLRRGCAACTSNADCGAGTCDDPVPTTGFGPGGYVTHVRTEPDGTFAAWCCRKATTGARVGGRA